MTRLPDGNDKSTRPYSGARSPPRAGANDEQASRSRSEPPPGTFEIFLATSPGLEEALLDEARAAGFNQPEIAKGGVTIQGEWPDVWRANLELRGASRVVARIGQFRALHLAQLDKRARKIAWGEILRRDLPFRVEATCRESRIYHSGAAAERVTRAIREELGAQYSDEAGVCVRVRLDDDMCILGVDTSGELLHKRGHKEAVAKAPMRENMAAMFLRQCGYDGREPVLDPMCGSGTFVIEAAEIAAGMKPGRSRRFAFEHLATFDADAWQQLKRAPIEVPTNDLRFYGSDRDAGAIRMSRANAERAGVDRVTSFETCDIADLNAPDGKPGLVMINAPYGDRIGDKSGLHALYRTLGQRLITGFKEWRVGLITTDAALANATGLPFKTPGAPVAHGGLRVTLWVSSKL